MNTITIKYSTGVLVSAGWRQVTITAIAEKTSAKMAKVIEVTEIDGEAPDYGMSRTGAKRQEFNGHYLDRREMGAKKRLSACVIVG